MRGQALLSAAMRKTLTTSKHSASHGMISCYRPRPPHTNKTVYIVLGGSDS